MRRLDLLGPPSRHGPVVVAIGSRLRLVDQPVCHGYANGCYCRYCWDRYQRPKPPKRPPDAAGEPVNEAMDRMMRDNRAAA